MKGIDFSRPTLEGMIVDTWEIYKKMVGNTETDTVKTYNIKAELIHLLYKYLKQYHASKIVVEIACSFISNADIETLQHIHIGNYKKLKEFINS